MSKTNTEPMQPDTQASEGLKLDVTVRPIARWEILWPLPT